MKHIRTAKGRKVSSTRWLERQLNDPYVKRAKAENYRSRAAYKLLELDERFNLLKGVKSVVDLGIAAWNAQRFDLLAHSIGVAYLLPVLVVPALLVTHGIVFWLLLRRAVPSPASA